MEQQQRLAYLFERYIEGSGTVSERAELMRLVADPAFEVQLKDLIQREKDRIDSQVEEVSKEQGIERAEAIFRNIIEGSYMSKEAVRVIPPARSFRWKIPVAAAIATLFGLGVYFMLIKKAKAPKNALVQQQADIKAPAMNRATIFLAGGQKVYLDSAANGALATQGGVRLLKLSDGNLAYNVEAKKENREMLYNTLSNPRGSKVVLLSLADGTRVWLDAESTLRYPVSFDRARKRYVEVTGEAYFEVAHNPNQPFVVKARQAEVEVLGTHFNVNAYDDEKYLKVTLLQGAVRISGKTGAKALRPGEQARVGDAIDVLRGVDTSEVMAWKNGLFKFNNAGLETILAQLGRWYDIGVRYEGQVPAGHFSGELERGLTLSQMTSALGELDVHFRIEGKTLVVRP